MADVTFESAASLQLLPRLVYALVRSPLLEASDKHHPDLRASLHHLWTALPPEELACAVYPRLASYADADHEALSRHSLSRAALLTSTAPLFLLDSYSHLMLLCTARWPAEQPFPPPLASAVRVRIAQQARRRQQTPAVRIVGWFFGGWVGGMWCENDVNEDHHCAFQWTLSVLSVDTECLFSGH